MSELCLGMQVNSAKLEAWSFSYSLASQTQDKTEKKKKYANVRHQMYRLIHYILGKRRNIVQMSCQLKPFN